MVCVLQAIEAYLYLSVAVGLARFVVYGLRFRQRLAFRPNVVDDTRKNRVRALHKQHVLVGPHSLFNRTTWLGNVRRNRRGR